MSFEGGSSKYDFRERFAEICRYSALMFSVNFVIHGYTGPLQEGDNLTLTCESDLPLSKVWIVTPNGQKPKLMSQIRTLHKYGIELADAGVYTCTTDDQDFFIRRALKQLNSMKESASIRVEVLKSASDNNSFVAVFTHNSFGASTTDASITDNSSSAEVFTHNIIIGDRTTDASVTDTNNSVEVLTYNIIIGGSAVSVIVVVINMVLVIALVQSCRNQKRLTSCKYNLILLIFHLKPVRPNCIVQC